MVQTLESLIEREFQEVSKTREDLLAKRQEIDDQLRALDLRHTAALNYKATLEGKFAAPASAPRKPRAPATGRAPRGSRDELKAKILDLVKQHPSGLVAKQITDAIPDKGIPNLLSLMKKEGQLAQDVKRGPYYVPEKAA